MGLHGFMTIRTNHLWRHGVATCLMNDLDRRFFCPQPFVTPSLHTHDDWPQIAPHSRKAVFVPWRMFAIGLTSENASSLKAFEACAQRRRWSTCLTLQLIKPAAAKKHFAKDHQHPDVPEYFGSARDGAGFFREICAAHELSLQYLKQPVTWPHRNVKKHQTTMTSSRAKAVHFASTVQPTRLLRRPHQNGTAT